MSRGLAGFLLFLGLVVIVIGGAALYLGPNGLKFVLHDERKTAPFVMVNLLDFDSDDAYQRYLADYAQPTLTMVKSLGGRAVWEGRLTELVAGEAFDHWQHVILVEYPSRAAFIDMVTSSEYRARLDARAAALGRTAVLAGSPEMPFEEGGRFLAVRLVQGASESWRERYAEEWWNEDAAILAVHGGRLVWHARLNPLVATEDEQFDAIFVFAFDTADGRSTWATDPERRTLRSLEQRMFRRDVLMLADTAHAAVR